VSTKDQTTDNQVLQANNAGYTIEPHRVVSETVSGGSTAATRNEFQSLLSKLESGDVLVVVKLDRLGRDNIDIQQTVESLVNKGIILRILDMPHEIKGAEGKLMLQIFAAFAEFEKNRISERTLAGLERAKSQGKKLGRPVATGTRKKVENIQKTGCTQQAAADALGVSLRTIQNYWKKSSY
jgi:DNA invertase Pin-like site-specific DNA recombinase